MKICTHTWVNKGFGDDYCSKCNITKEQLALGLNTIVEEFKVAEKSKAAEEVEVKQVTLADIYPAKTTKVGKK